MIERACQEVAFSNPETRVAISGSGNVAQYAALKVIELGAKVASLSDSRGSFVSQDSFTVQEIQKISALKLRGGSLKEIASEGKWTYHEGARPWTLVGKVDIALPCATQNEVSGAEAEALVKAGARVVAEGSNMVRKHFRLTRIARILMASYFSGLHARGHCRLRGVTC